MVASYAMSMLKGEADETALKRAAAISAAHTATLESGDILLELAEELLEKVQIENRGCPNSTKKNWPGGQFLVTDNAVA